jgi:hypothetical protein
MGTPITGVVEAIDSRNTKFGEFFSVKINGRKYEHGKYAPRDIQQGDTVTLEYEAKQNGQYTNYNIVPRTLRKETGAAPAASPSPAAAPPAKAAYGGFDARQDVISKQAAVNTALTFVELAISQGAVAPLPKTAKDAERLTLLRAWVLDEAKKFYELNTGGTWNLPEQEAAASPADRRSGKAKTVETSTADTGSNEFPDDDIPF